MTLAEIYTILNSTTAFAGKVVYRSWEEGQVPAMPFVTYYYKDNASFYADGKLYYAAKNISIDLFTKEKDPTSEAAVESALTNNGLPFAKSEEFIPEENCYCITYDLGV